MQPSRTPFPDPRSRTQFRALTGILLLDKPQGLSSNRALQNARHIFRAEKAGHTGSLDPLATGVLPICFGEATKIAGLLLGKSKAYVTRAMLGATTDTDDADGQVLRQRPVSGLDSAVIEAALAPLRGRIMQRPPIYSALKRGGEPLYAKARRGEVVEVEQRQVDVHRSECVARGNDWLDLEIDCGSGTYVRSLVRDLGEMLGCGAHVGQLRRLWVDPFRTPQLWKLEALQELAGQGEDALDACLLPIEAGLQGMPAIHLDATQAVAISQGKPVLIASAATQGTVALYDATGRALGLGRIEVEGIVRAQRLFTWAVSTV